VLLAALPWGVFFSLRHWCWTVAQRGGVASLPLISALFTQLWIHPALARQTRGQRSRRWISSYLIPSFLKPHRNPPPPSLHQALMTDETIGNVPILILGNKIDRPEAVSEEKLREIFGLYGQTTGKVGGRPPVATEIRRWVFCCCFNWCLLWPPPPVGHHRREGAEHEAPGGVHVQRAEEAGLRRGLPLALPVHRLEPTPRRHGREGVGGKEGGGRGVC